MKHTEAIPSDVEKGLLFFIHKQRPPPMAVVALLFWVMEVEASRVLNLSRINEDDFKLCTLTHRASCCQERGKMAVTVQAEVEL